MECTYHEKNEEPVSQQVGLRPGMPVAEENFSSSVGNVELEIASVLTWPP
jgi:hypothetical protein